MRLNKLGELNIQSKLIVPSITLNNNDLQTTLNNKADLVDPVFTSDITMTKVGACSIIFNSKATTPNFNYIAYEGSNNLNIIADNEAIM